MAVLMPNTEATLLRRPESTLNSHGQRVTAPPTADAEPVGPLLPALVEQDSSGGWALSLDYALWPVRQHDLVIDASGQVFTILTADPAINVFDSTVNYVRCTGLRVGPDGTEPADGYFVGRT